MNVYNVMFACHVRHVYKTTLLIMSSTYNEVMQHDIIDGVIQCL